ncbi:MAG: hypothetical protein GF418_01180 [Chitinivibrionales bacterium]|nr:hypothetical protein [Chitinivibrionales bacterium]MBD3394214.1 hypothetical protein [Chitinivibrionales bacterium]
MIQFGDTLEPDKVLQLLSSSLPYYLASWHDDGPDAGLFGTVDPVSFNMRKVGSSSPVIEYVMRPHAQILCILAVLVRRDSPAGIDEGQREELVEKITKGLRWACDTHLTGSRDVEPFLGRKRWGENWRSGLWAGMLGMAAFFARDALHADLFARVCAVLAFEADRFIGVLPPSGCEIDTKMEENAEDAMAMAWAANLMPDHEHAAQWEESLRRWGINIASSFFDAADHKPYYGRSVAKWVTTRTLYPDMTAENHGFFHPHALTYAAWVVLGMAAYALHGREEPLFFRRKNHQDTFDVLLRFCLPNGMLYEPGANDLPLFVPRPFALAWGLWNNDPRAAHMTVRLLNWMSSVLAGKGAAPTPWVLGFEAHHEGWELLFQSQVGFELAMLAVLPFAKEARFYSSGQIESAVDTCQIYPYVEVCYRRNTRATRSVAWKALGKHPIVGFSVHTYPELIVPSRAAMLGIPSTEPAIKRWEVAFHADRLQREGFDTCGRILYLGADGLEVLHRDVRVLTWGDDGLLVFDQIKAAAPVRFEEQYLSNVHLANDHWTNNRLDLFSGSLRETIKTASTTGRILSCPSFWASLEAQFLFQFVWGRSKGLYFLPGNGRNAPRYWKNCRLDMLGVHVEQQECGAGETPYEVGFYVGAGKGPKPFKCAGSCGEFFKGLVIMDGKSTVGLS